MQYVYVGPGRGVHFHGYHLVDADFIRSVEDLEDALQRLPMPVIIDLAAEEAVRSRVELSPVTSLYYDCWNRRIHTSASHTGPSH